MPRTRRAPRARKTRKRGGAGIDDELFTAINAGNIEEVTRLIEAGADVNKGRPEYFGITPLYRASSVGRLGIVIKLIEAGADVNKAIGTGMTPLIVTNNLQIVEKLIEAGADINKADRDGVTAAWAASQDGRLDILMKLIEAGADINKADRKGVTPLWTASEKGRLEIVTNLIEAGADVNKSNRKGVTPLWTASEKGRLEIVTNLIEAGADVNKPNDMERTPLYIACQNGHLEVVKKLLEANADVNKANNNSETTPLYIASQQGHLEIVTKLIEAGADLNKATTDYGATPLYAASERGHLEIVTKLIEAGADVNKANRDGITPIYIVSQQGHLEIVTKLIEAGADVNKANRDVITPLWIASYKGYLEIVKTLLEAGADVNKAEKVFGNTPLYNASNMSHLEIVKTLLEAGADKTIPNKAGKLPIDVAKTVEIRNLLKPQSYVGPKLLWEGWTRGDASKLDGIFAEEAISKNFALCPVCMKYVERSDACMYMAHNCSESKGYYHEDLYNKYKNSEGIINWCTICGRICKGHNHFHLSPAQGPVPSIIIGKAPFARDCIEEGGGSLPEKLLRFRRLREHARDLQAEVGRMGWWEAMDELCEEMWNAPMVRSRALTTMQTDRRFNIPNTEFPVILPPQPNSPNIPYFLPTNTEETKKSKLPIVHSEGENAWGMDTENIIQFQHKRKNGFWNRHTGPGEQISREAFIGWLKQQIGNPTGETFGYCWAYKTPSQLLPLNEAEKAKACDATLHPEEVKAALDLSDPEQARLAEGYRKAFNAAFDVRRTMRHG